MHRGALWIGLTVADGVVIVSWVNAVRDMPDPWRWLVGLAIGAVLATLFALLSGHEPVAHRLVAAGRRAALARTGA